VTYKEDVPDTLASPAAWIHCLAGKRLGGVMGDKKPVMVDVREGFDARAAEGKRFCYMSF